MVRVKHKTLEELSGKELEYVKNTYCDVYAASNKQLSFAQLDDVGNIVSIAFLKRAELKLEGSVAYGCKILGIYGVTAADRLDAISCAKSRISQWVLKKDVFFYFYYVQSTKDSIENDLIDYGAEKFIYWRDNSTVEYYAYKVIDRTTLVD